MKGKELVVKIPNESEFNFRCFIVSIKGKVLNDSRKEKELKELKERCWIFCKNYTDLSLCTFCKIDCVHRIKK